MKTQHTEASQKALANDDGEWLFHVTREVNLYSIVATGVHATSYWTNRSSIVEYYRDVVRGEAHEPFTLAVRLARLVQGALRVDRPSVAEPISTALGESESEIQEKWAACAGTWQDSLQIVGSVSYGDVVRRSDLYIVQDSGAMMPLMDWMPDTEQSAEPGIAVVVHEPTLERERDISRLLVEKHGWTPYASLTNRSLVKRVKEPEVGSNGDVYATFSKNRRVLSFEAGDTQPFHVSTVKGDPGDVAAIFAGKLAEWATEVGVEFRDLALKAGPEQGVAVSNEEASAARVAARIGCRSDETVLNTVVEDECAALARGVNDAGIEAQVKYLMSNGWSEELILGKAGVGATKGGAAA
ncbi:hypothetical protein [Paraburkholderia youngii]|uniref:hypothetical protein n=1 Tax=Paraburkholderia youngii TaxID=2782701 RepID=UPI003D23A443